MTFSIIGVPASSGVLANYVTLANNKPQTFDNHLLAWDSPEDLVPWDKTPVGRAKANCDDAQNSQVIPFPYEDKAYVFGYSVAAGRAGTCATVFIPRGQGTNPAAWKTDAVEIGIVIHDSSAIEYRYRVLPGYSPNSRKNWVGIWCAQEVPYAGAPLGSSNIFDDSESGMGFIDKLSLLINTTYAVGYFMGPLPVGRTALAAAVTFTTSP